MAPDVRPVILQLFARAPAPCRDYGGLSIRSSGIVFNIWNVSHGPHVYPKCHSCTLEEFEEDRPLQSEILRLFGKYVLEYTMSICRKEKNLQNLPTKAFHRVLNYLAAKDILHLSQSSKIMFDVIYKNGVWRILYGKCFSKKAVGRDVYFASAIGWRDVLKKRINKDVDVGKSVTRKITLAKETRAATAVIKNTNNSKSNMIDFSRVKDVNLKANLPKENKNVSKINTLLGIAKSKQVCSKTGRPKTAMYSADALNNASNLKKSGVQSVANLTNRIRNDIQAPKSRSKITNLKSAKNAGIRIEIPIELEQTVACMNSNVFENSKHNLKRSDLKSAKTNAKLTKK